MLHVTLLGEQIISDDSPASATRSSRTVALVAYLAAHAGRPQPRQRIAGLFWPESAEAQALTNLRRELHHLRQALGREPSLWSRRGTCAGGTPAPAGSTCGCSPPTGRRRGPPPRPVTTPPRSTHAGGPSPSTAATCSRLLRRLAHLLGRARAPVRRPLRPAGQAGPGKATSGGQSAARRRIQLQPLEEAGYRTLMRLQADLGDRAGRAEHLPPLCRRPGTGAWRQS